jgi:rubrerythrin
MGNNVAARRREAVAHREAADLLERATPEAVPDDFIEFFACGTLVTGEFHCSECGFRVTVHAALRRCPMCGGESWEQVPWSPFTRRRQAL